MCMGHGYGPPFGIPIEQDTFDQYSPELKVAWETFDAWWTEAHQKADGDSVSRSSMPQGVRQAMELILTTPIPGYEGEFTGADSCYMVGVNSMMTD